MVRLMLRSLLAVSLFAAWLAVGFSQQPPIPPIDRPNEKSKGVKEAAVPETSPKQATGGDKKTDQSVPKRAPRPIGSIEEPPVDFLVPLSPNAVALLGGTPLFPLVRKWNSDFILDLDLDDLPLADLPVKEPDVNVDAPLIDVDINIGLPNSQESFGTRLFGMGRMPFLLGLGDGSATGLDCQLMTGSGGFGASLATPGFQGRTGAVKIKLLQAGGGNAETEAAVARSLVWLAKQQKTDGSWEFDGSRKNDRVAATGMCLLPFLAAGETHKTGQKYKTTVAKGLEYLKAQLKPNGQFNGVELSNTMYSHAIGTTALCEAAGMTRDESIKRVARLTVDYLVKAQSNDGSWGYSAGTNGDTSIVGWQIQALKSATLANIPVNKKVFDQAGVFLDSVSADSGRTYGYRTKGATRTLTAVGLLSREFMGWTPRQAELAGGIDFLWDKYPPKEDEWDLYYYYYATQVFHFFDGPKWRVNWNPAIRAILLKKQITEKSVDAKAGDVGSFPKDNGFIGSQCGKLGTTALACLTLEVYYRHLPLFKRDNPVEEKK